jgi:hypothetical protein
VPEGTFVINASPLIFLDQIGGLVWLKQLAKEVVVPAAVLEEITAGIDLSPGLTPQRINALFRAVPDFGSVPRDRCAAADRRVGRGFGWNPAGPALRLALREPTGAAVSLPDALDSIRSRRLLPERSG